MNNETALITGASSGIGLHLAKEFSQHGHPLVLVAPVESELRAIAQDLRTNAGLEPIVIAKDLEEPGAAQEIFDELQSGGVTIDRRALFNMRWRRRTSRKPDTKPA